MIPPFLQRWPIDFFLVAMPYTLLEQEGLEELEICAARGGSIVICAPYVSGIPGAGSRAPARSIATNRPNRRLLARQSASLMSAAATTCRWPRAVPPWGTAASLRSSRGRSHPRKCAKTLPGCGSRSPRRYGRTQGQAANPCRSADAASQRTRLNPVPKMVETQALERLV